MCINLKILWNHGLVENCPLNNPSVCKCLGQCGKVSADYRRESSWMFLLKQHEFWSEQWKCQQWTTAALEGNPLNDVPMIDHSMVNELGQCQFSPLDMTVGNSVSHDSCFWTSCVIRPWISSCRWTLLSTTLSRRGNGVLWMACFERAVQYSFSFKKQSS